MNTPFPQLPVTPNREGTVRTYTQMRDELWRELVDLPGGEVPARLVGLLELCNNVVKTLLGELPESLNRSLELLRCGICETWIARARYELRILKGEVPKIDINFVRASLELAITKEKPLPPPAPSTFCHLDCIGTDAGKASVETTQPLNAS